MHRPQPKDAQIARDSGIDAAKGIAILAVILLHGLPREALFESLAWFHVWQAVPVFAVLMGMTGHMTRIRPLSAYLGRRLLRLGPPILVVWLVSMVISLARGTFAFGPLLLAGVFPASGPGNYYVTLLMQYVLVLPLLKPSYARFPRSTLIGAALLSVGFEFVAGAMGPAIDPYIYSSCVLRYLFAIVLGMWIADGRTITVPAVIGVGYMAAFTTGFRIPWFVDSWQPQNVAAFGYSAALTRWLTHWPAVDIPLLRGFGRASLHVFLVQMLWFGQAAPLLGLPLAVSVVSALVVCLGAGYAFWAIEQRVSSRLTRSDAT